MDQQAHCSMMWGGTGDTTRVGGWHGAYLQHKESTATPRLALRSLHRRGARSSPAIAVLSTA